ncbi:glycoside hydrolase family 76 [Catenulispora acidiphila DSM 44928]|uniref:Glycoside hydrolase family 76 n=1 Tax=Catenulispora acidiphila (strain DSM 44928 / JCM 14897 / NBRC 102108 / NRRL B-24433 / ID139908) TaxID=479433 RepID=C7Q3E9_CATAD|nr:RICIN domain-containing protein [Catenulispora acidiphila]ACU75714.1 glycoside hydrolase family 76 [Catenulispora acidiphila DSM 44928]
MKRKTALAATCTALLLGVTGAVMLAPSAVATASLPSATTVYQDWNKAFLVQANGETFYNSELKSKGIKRSTMWIAALDIQVAQDRYDLTHSAADRQVAVDLVTTYIKHEGTDWASWDGWNDDLAWDITTVLRGYQQSGNTAWLTVAEDQFAKTYNRGWSSAGGGGIWEHDTSGSKCALSNDPMISIASTLYQITGDQAYLTKAKAIYAWMRSKVVNTSTGVVNECVSIPKGKSGPTTLLKSDNAYNAGSWIEAADNLYRITGDTQYRDDAQRTADHFLNHVPIVANSQGNSTSYQYWLFKGIGDFCTDANLCSRYDAWMRSNAAKAWSERDSDNVTWNNWNKKTDEPNADAFEMIGMVAVFQALPDTAASPFKGTYEIKNVHSGLSLGAKGDSTAASAPIVQNKDTKDASASWSFVQESNGYYEIKNVRSGLILAVSGTLGKPGSLVVQSPAAGIRSGEDQWMPVKNSDGTWSFSNRNSKLALDNYTGSTAAGNQYGQWTPTDGSDQRFDLISR